MSARLWDKMIEIMYLFSDDRFGCGPYRPLEGESIALAAQPKATAAAGAVPLDSGFTIEQI